MLEVSLGSRVKLILTRASNCLDNIVLNLNNNVPLRNLSNLIDIEVVYIHF